MCVDLGGGGSLQTPWKIQFSLIYIVSLLPICLGHPPPGNKKKSLDPPPPPGEKNYGSAHATHFIMNQYQHVHIT